MFEGLQGEKSAAIEQKLNDLESQAQYLADRGKRPMTWHEFQKQHADIKPEGRSILRTVTGLSIGAALAVGAGIAIVQTTGAPIDPTLAWAGGIGLVGGGALIGSNFTHPLDKREAQVKAYEKYIQSVEMSVEQRGKGMAREDSHSSAHDQAIGNPLPHNLRNSLPEKGR